MIRWTQQAEIKKLKTKLEEYRKLNRQKNVLIDKINVDWENCKCCNHNADIRNTLLRMRITRKSAKRNAERE